MSDDRFSPMNCWIVAVEGGLKRANTFDRRLIKTYERKRDFIVEGMSAAFKENEIKLPNIFRKIGVDNDTPSESVEDTGGSESSKRGRGKKSPGGVKPTKLPTCSLPTNMTPTFYVGGGNGTSLVEAPLLGLGWKRITDKYDERFRLKWVECKSRINYGSFREGEQLVNHVPNSHLLTNKLGLLNSLKEYERVTLSTKGRLPRLRMSDFHPETYKLDEKSDRDLFLEVYKDNEIWICKPVGMNQGKGIFLIRTREEINQLLEEREQKKQQAQKPGRPLMNRIVQRYIMNPLLLDGRKFDVRAYMLVASTVPFLILYHKGYVRLSCLKYNSDDTNLGIHLTNQFVQKKDPNYKELKEDTAWSMDKFNDYVNEQVRPDCPVEIEEDWVYNTFTKQMQKIMIHCFNSVKHKLQSRIGFFDLFGLDFMVDTEMKVHLIEVNTNPALHCNCEALKEVIPGVVEETLYVAIECFEKSKKNQQLMPLQSLKNFTILYCGTRPNTIVPRQIRSVSPVKENSTADKPKPLSMGGPRRGSSPTRQGQRSLTQSTPLYNTNQRRTEKNDSNIASNGNKDSVSNSTSKSVKTSASVKTSISAKTRHENKGKDIESVKTEGIKQTNDNSEPVVDNNDNNDNKPGSATKSEPRSEPRSRGSTVVVDTLSKTTDSLNEATSALGKISLSLNQGGITDSLLEEVKLKMTHAETSNTGSTPNSSHPPTRERENLERGN
ncbi:Tubulin tyrosine ligase-like [Mactra antiquata]